MVSVPLKVAFMRSRSRVVRRVDNVIYRGYQFAANLCH
jgi:hypothetical protein